MAIDLIMTYPHQVELLDGWACQPSPWNSHWPLVTAYPHQVASSVVQLPPNSVGTMTEKEISTGFCRQWHTHWVAPFNSWACRPNPRCKKKISLRGGQSRLLLTRNHHGSVPPLLSKVRLGRHLCDSRLLLQNDRNGH